MPDMAALTRVVARQRAEMDRLQDLVATSAVLERAKGALMAQFGSSPDAAQEELQQRAKTARRTLLEECWITLGAIAPRPGTAAEPAPAAALVRGTAFAPDSDGVDAALDRLSRALVRVGTPHDLARCLLDQLAQDVGADGVMIYLRPPAGGLELIGHAGIDDTLAQQWSRVPPVSGLAAMAALDTGEPRWLEDPRQDDKRYLLIGDPPEQWGSRAWLPVATGGSAEVTLGILRRREGAFTPRVREHLLAAAQLCAGPLRTFGTRQDPAAGAAADSVQTVFDRLSVAAVLLTPLRSASGHVEDFRIDAATSVTSDAMGRGGSELVGLRFLECWPEVADDPLWEGCLEALAGETPYESDPFARQQTVAGVSELATYSARAARLGDGLVVSWVRQDPSDRQEQRLADVQRLGNLGWATWNLETGEGNWSSQVFTILERDPAWGVAPLSGLPGSPCPRTCRR